jgi:aspartyl-tRNA(Asn)/glutamyl-tRNA(Gln) amidotransferase subunit A
MPHILSVSAAAADLAAGRRTSESIVAAALERIADPAGEGARAFLHVEAVAALAAARSSDRLRARGVVPSPLAGLPVSIKDLFDVAGEVTRAGSRVLDASPRAREDAAAVARLRAAGAILLGRTNMTEFAFSGLGINPHYGTPASPYERQSTRRIAGGSTSGGAVSVADGMAVAALGTDTGGSVRIPAAYCGVVGFKPTASRVPTAGAFPLSSSLDTVGVIAPTVDCCALLDAILAAAPAHPPHVRELRGLRIGVVGNYLTDDLDAQVAASVDAALARLSRRGAALRGVKLASVDRVVTEGIQGALAAAEAWAQHRALLARRGGEYDPRVAARILSGRSVSAADYIMARRHREAIVAGFREEADSCDVLVAPTVVCVPPALEPLERDDVAYGRANLRALRNTAVVNALDGCALSLPCHAPGDAPVGLMLFAPADADARLLAAGRAVERALAA